MIETVPLQQTTKENKTFEEFVKALETDETLKAKVKEALETGEVKAEEAKISALVKIVAENGYKVSTEDFAKRQSACQELDEDELNLVSGGETDYCPADYACDLLWNTCVISDECKGSHSCEDSVL